MDIRPEGYLSLIETARITGYSEGRVRTLVSNGTLPSVKLGQRRWLPEVAISQLVADRLVLPASQKVMLAKMRRNAEMLGVELSPDEDVIRGAELYLDAANAVGQLDRPAATTPSVWDSILEETGRELEQAELAELELVTGD